MGPCTASSCCCQVQSVSWVPVRPPIAAELHRQTLPCATFRSPYTVGGFHFVIGCCMAFHCCCLHRHPAPCASVVCSRCWISNHQFLTQLTKSAMNHAPNMLLFLT
ncbi:unnamed protein product [Staurois parvus]|uniref:Secreted protein n=1 Tax=Staurois parvus TaxID=386267 RepID=A0ABN9BKG1_9NEOB|nr:unnamed protein product [Staurois parvus]